MTFDLQRLRTLYPNVGLITAEMVVEFYNLLPQHPDILGTIPAVMASRAVRESRFTGMWNGIAKVLSGGHFSHIRDNASVVELLMKRYPDPTDLARAITHFAAHAYEAWPKVFPEGFEAP